MGEPTYKLPMGLTKSYPLLGLNSCLNIHNTNNELSSYVKNKAAEYNLLLVVTDPRALPGFMHGYFDPSNRRFTDKLPACAPAIPQLVAKNTRILFSAAVSE